MNRQSRRHPSSSCMPACHPSKNSVITTNEKRKNVAVKSGCMKQKKAERGK